MFSIKSTTPADIPLIRDLTFRVWPQTYASILSQEQVDYMLDMMYSETSLQNQMKEGARFIIVHDEKEPVGFASYQEIKPGIYKLHKIYVLQSQQGKGTGKFLIQYIQDDIGSKKATALQLQVNLNNKARYFYEKLGFTIIDQIKLDIGNGFFMNDYIMEKKLSQGA